MQTFPSTEELRQFKPFENLDSTQIHVISTLKQAQQIENELKMVKIFGFDSESKPTFQKGEISTGPHLIQLATTQHAYLFQMNDALFDFLQPILANPQQLKVGFGLKNDAHLFRQKGIELNNTIELSKCFTHFGFHQTMGIKNAIAFLFQRYFAKSKKVSTSNWAQHRLTPAQIQYATADAYVALLVFLELQRLKALPEHVIQALKALQNYPQFNLKPEKN